MGCDERRDDLLDVLYGEADEATQQRFDAHRGQCPSCQAEILSLGALRQQLGEWRLPAPIDVTPVSPPTRWALPSYLAVAAALVVAVGGALVASGSELRYADGRLSFRLGRSAGEIERLLDAREARHQQEIAALKASLVPPAATDDQVLARVGEMIRASEARQASLLLAHLSDRELKAERQRQYDLARLSAGLSYLDGKTGLETARTRQMVNYVLQAANQP